MTYKCVKKIRDGKELDFDTTQYYATWGGEEPDKKDPFVSVWKDGSITLNCEGIRLFLYRDQWEGVMQCLNRALQDLDEERQNHRKNWLNETMDSLEFYGTKVDLSRRETINILKTGEMKVNNKKPSIFYQNKWYSLGRTDLQDDVATLVHLDLSIEEWRNYFLKKAKNCMGTRLTEYSLGPGFNIIDSFSDG